MVVENDKVKLRWDFEYRIRKETTECRPDVTIDNKDRKLIYISAPVTKTSMKKRLGGNYISINNWPMRPGRGDHDHPSGYWMHWRRWE